MAPGTSVIARRRNILLLSGSLLAVTATGASAQVSCVGVTDIVCTNSSVTETVGNSPIGAYLSSGDLTIVNTASGVAGSILANVDDRADATVLNYGVVNSTITAVAGVFYGNAVVGSASISNYGEVAGYILAKTDFAGDASVYNAGTAGTLRATTNSSVFGDATAWNDGTAANIVVSANAFFAKASATNMGETGVIRVTSFADSATLRNYGFANALVAEGVTSVELVNAGKGVAVITATARGGPVTVWNSGSVSGSISASSDSAAVFLTNSSTVGGGLSVAAASGATIKNSGAIRGGARVAAAASSISILKGASVRNFADGGDGLEITGRSSVTLAGTVGGGEGGLAIRFDQNRDTDDRLELREGFSLVGAVDAGGGRDTLAFGGGANSWSFGVIQVNREDYVDDVEVDMFAAPVVATPPVEIPGSTPSAPFPVPARTSTVLNFEEISGTSAAAGLIRLRGEPVDFNATMRNADVQVELGSRIGGTGTMRNLTVQSFGTLDPGAANAIGTLAAAGTARFEDASRYAVDIAADGRTDLLKAGQVEIDGGFVVGFLPARLGPVTGGRSVIIEAENGVTGAFEDAVSPYAFFDFALDYTPTEVGLTTRVKALETAAVTGNQRAAARGLQGFATSANPEALAFYEGLLSAQDFAQVRPIFDAVSGEAHASLQSGLAQSSLTFARSARDRAGTNAEAGAPADAPLAYAGEPIVTTAFEGVSKVAPAPTSLAWGAILGERWSSDRGGARTEQNLGGVIGGLDLFHVESAFGAVWGGLSFGYANASLDVGARSSKAKTDSGHAGLYGALDSGPLLVSAAASYGFHGADTERRIAFAGATAKADYDAHSLGFSGEARYRFAFGALTLAPLVTLDAAHVMTRSGRERGAGALNLSAKSDSYTAGAAGAGGAIAVAWSAGTLGTVHADARAVYEHGFGRDPSRRVSFADGPSFTVTGASADHDRLAVGLGLSVEHANGLTVGARYDGGFAKDAKSHRGQIAASYRF